MLRQNQLRVLLWATAFLVCHLSTSCETKEVLPDDPGLLLCTFGSGVKLMMPYSEAIVTASNLDPGSRLKIDILTREKLQTTNPYADHTEQQDLMIALYDDPAAATPDTPYESLGIIREIRCYLADSDNSVLTYSNRKISTLGPSEMVSFFGEPYSTNVYSGIETHLVYRFAAGSDEAEQQLLTIRLTTSHLTNDSCYAFSLVLEGET